MRSSTETIAAGTMDMNTRLQEHSGHANTRRRRDLAFGHGEIRREESGRLSWGKGKGCGASPDATWREEGGRGGLEDGRRRGGVVERSAASSEQLELDDRRGEVGLGCGWARG